MSHFPYHDPHCAPEDARPQLDAAERKFGMVPLDLSRLIRSRQRSHGRR